MKSRQEIQMELCAPDAVRESAEGLEFNVREFFEAQAKGNAKDMRWHAHHAKEALGGLMIAAANGVFDCPEMDGPTPRNRMEPGDASRPRTVADLTAIPEVFGLTYWGAFKIAPNADVITAEVIANRDRLVADYKVEKLAGIRVEMDPRPRSEMDHPEVYALRGGGLLLLCSNYGTKRPPCVLKMRPIAPVYSTACTTYARTFPNVRELKAAIRAAGGRS